MAKKLVAVIEIHHGDYVVPVGDTLDASNFSKKELEALYDAGAVRVDGGSGNEESNTQEPISADQSAAASSPAKATPAPAKSAPAPAVKETANDKGTTK